MTKWELFHRIAEAAYFLSGIAIAVIAGLGLRQIRLAKDSLKQAEDLARVSAQRESYRLAGESCDYYRKEIIPAADAGFVALTQFKLREVVEKFEVLCEEKGLVIKPPKDLNAKSFNDAVRAPSCGRPILECCNLFESFAVPLVTGVAAESIAFRSVGPSYCQCVRQFLPVLFAIVGEDLYPNTTVLYHLWQTRIEMRQLKNAQVNIAEKLSKKRDVPIKPIGT